MSKVLPHSIFDRRFLDDVDLSEKKINVFLLNINQKKIMHKCKTKKTNKIQNKFGKKRSLIWLDRASPQITELLAFFLYLQSIPSWCIVLLFHQSNKIHLDLNYSNRSTDL